jgi:hypothetical protein
MARPMIRIHDLATNEIIDREMTVEEFEEFTNPKVEVPDYHAEIAARETGNE